MRLHSIRLLVLLAVGFSFIGCQADSNSGNSSDFSVERSYESTFTNEPGTNLTFVYVGSQDCAPCHDPEMKKAIEEAKVKLQAHASSEGHKFSAVGVVKNHEWREGLDFLKKTGYFDEVVAGRSWHNTAVIQHCWKRDDCRPAIPKVIVYRQEVSQGESRLKFGKRKYLTTVTGADNITAWAEAGAKLPH